MYKFSVATLVLCLCTPVDAQTSSVWIGPNSGSWGNTSFWDPALPDDQGAEAVFQPGTTAAEFFIALDSNAYTVGSIRSTAPTTVTVGAGTLILNQDGLGVESANVIVRDTADGGLRLDTNLVLQDDLFLQPVGVGNTIEFAGIATGTGNINIAGDGSVRFAATADAWAGTLAVDSGSVFIASPSAVGGSGTVFLNGGRTTLEDTGLYAMSPTIADATLQVNEFATLSSPIHTVAGTTATIVVSGTSRRSGLVLDGGVSGPGSLNLEFAGSLTINDSLSHDGSLQIFGTDTSLGQVRLNADSSYRGQTIIDHARVNASTSQALGESSVGTSLRNGAILRISGQTTEPITVQHSELILTGDPPTGLSLLTPVTLGDGGTLSVDSFRGGNDFRFNLPITLAGEDALISSNGERVFIDGGIVGSGSLGFGGVDINSVIALSEGSILTGGMTFNREDAYGGVIQLGTPSGSSSGRVVANADQQFSKLELFRGEIITAPGIKVRADHLKLRDGEIDGDIVDDGLLRIFPSQTLTFKRLGDYTGQIEVLRGAIGFGADNPLGSVDTAIRLSGLGENEVVVDLSDTPSITVANPIDLNNKHGFFGRGAIRVLSGGLGPSSVTLTGPLTLGDRGATIGEASRELHLAGPIVGGDLFIVDNISRTVLSSSELAYTGATRLRNANVSLIGDAALSETSTIQLNRARFNLESSNTEGINHDRIDDSLIVELSSAALHHLTFNVDVPVTEHIGQIDLKQGFNETGAVAYYDTDVIASPSETTLVLDEVIRETGAVLNISRPDSSFLRTFMRSVQDGNVILNQPPALRNGVLPGWIQENGQYATLGPNNDIQGIELPDGDINAVAATSNIRIRNDQIMTADRSVNALRIFDSTTVDLGGNQLTLDSGAIELGFQGSNTVVTNGSITIGEDTGQEFFFILRGQAILNAEITDNGQPVNVVYAGGGIEVGAIQTYSGKTYLSGAGLQIIEHGAVPIGGDIDVIGGRIDIRVNGIQDFGEVLIADEGSLVTGFNAAINAQSLTIESGNLGVPLAGDFIVRKIGTGTARMTARDPSLGFTGEVHVEDGRLVFEEGDIFAGKTIQVFGGAVSSGAVTVDTDIELRGGDLQGGRFNNVTVFSDSRIYSTRVEGDLVVKSNQTLTIDAYPGDSVVFATGQFVLESGATLSGGGEVGNELDLTDAIVDPGPSAETLRMQALTLGPNGRYRFSINDLAGDAGARFGMGWDLLLSEEKIEITATQQNPFVIEILMQDLFEDAQALSGFDVNQRYAWVIAEGTSIDGYEPTRFRVDTAVIDELFDLSSSRFSVEQFDNQLMLVHVPEPSSLALLGFGGLLIIRRRRASYFPIPYKNHPRIDRCSTPALSTAPQRFKIYKV